ncbi:MAG: LamG domain-containing protein [Candidatus Aureabacteria bacterium]|nr:LamG domain-containing protein [Candidatus Auribacterota bacterium]
MRATVILVVSVMIAAGFCGMAVAGSLDAPGAPSSGSGMYSLTDIYNYLAQGTPAPTQSAFKEPGSGPTLGTMRTLREIYEDHKAVLDQCNVTADKVASGTRFFCTQPGSWGLQTGIALLVPTPTPTATPTITPTPTVTPTITPTSSLYGGIVSYYKLDETSGNFADSVGGNSLLPQGTVSRVAGKIGNAVELDNNPANYLVTASNLGITGNSARTISFWAYEDKNSEDETYLGWGTGSQDHKFCYMFSFYDGRGLQVSLYNNDDYPAAKPQPPINQWVMHTVTHNGTQIIFFINGSSVGSVAETAANTGDSKLYVGYDPVYTDPYDGKIDELGIWSRALTSSEVTELRNSGNGKALY